VNLDDRDFDTLMKRMDSQDKDLREIKKHVQATNGRVGMLEKWQSYLDGRNAAIGERHTEFEAWKVAIMAALVSGCVGGVFLLLTQVL